MRSILKKYFLAGFFAFIPLFLTIFIVAKIWGYWVLMLSYLFPIKTIVRSLSLNIPSKYVYFLVYSCLTTFLMAVIWLIGYATIHYINKEKGKWIENIFLKLPVFKFLYSTFKQISQILVTDSSPYSDVVIIEYPKAGLYSLGFVTSKDFNALSSILGEESYVSVFIPTAPNPTSGMFVVAKQKDLIIIDASIEEAFKFIISAGAIPPKNFS